MDARHARGLRILVSVTCVGSLILAAALPALAQGGGTSVGATPTTRGPADVYTADSWSEVGLGPNPPSGGNTSGSRGPLQPVSMTPTSDGPGEVNGINVSSVGPSPVTYDLQDPPPEQNTPAPPGPLQPISEGDLSPTGALPGEINGVNVSSVGPSPVTYDLRDSGPSEPGPSFEIPPELQPAVDAVFSHTGGPAGEGVQRGMIYLLGQEAGEAVAPWFMGTVGGLEDMYQDHTGPNAQNDVGSLAIDTLEVAANAGTEVGSGMAATGIYVWAFGTTPTGWAVLGVAIVGSAVGNYANTYVVDPVFDALGEAWVEFLNDANLTVDVQTGELVPRGPYDSVGPTGTTGGTDMDHLSHVRTIQIHVIRPPNVTIRPPVGGGRGPCRPGCPDFRR